MSKTVFKGGIGLGEVSARFQSDSSNADSDLLVISFAEAGGGNPQVENEATAPGGSCTVKLRATGAGLLEVWVVIGAESDKGQLSVRRNGSVVDDEPIQGSVRWVYAPS
jgi:hypothetical protein